MEIGRLGHLGQLAVRIVINTGGGLAQIQLQAKEANTVQDLTCKTKTVLEVFAKVKKVNTDDLKSTELSFLFCVKCAVKSSCDWYIMYGSSFSFFYICDGLEFNSEYQ